MATDTSASIHPLHQPQPKKALTPAERARAYRQRKRERTAQAVTLAQPRNEGAVTFPVTVTPPAPSRITTIIAPPRRPPASYLLVAAAFALAVVGVTMNGWFARSLGSSESAGWLFLAVGVAADLAALAIPAAAARHWQACRRGTAAAGWLIWIMTFAFAVTAGIGFASVNITDVTLSRASRITPAVTTAQAALSDAVVARDRECKGGVGRFCREREQTVNERRQVLNVAMRSVEQTADPQSEAAVRMVAWLTGGTLQPRENDFAMLRLILLALLPQIGGLLLMVARS